MSPEVKSKSRLDATKGKSRSVYSKADTSPSKSGVPSKERSARSGKSNISASNSAPQFKDDNPSKSYISGVDSQAQQTERNLTPGQIEPGSKRGTSSERFVSEHLFPGTKRSESRQTGQSGFVSHDPISYQSYADPSQSRDTYQGSAMGKYELEKDPKRERMIKILRWFAYT